jgi:NAD(P)-dependent dehydrogenase (short-subunit alcohol dehydrogenase family)
MATKRLFEKVCVVTGSSSGLGRAIALAYAREGAHVVCSDLSSVARAQVAKERTINTDELVRQQGQKSIFVPADVSKASDMQNLVQEAAAKFGRVDV